MSNYSIFFDYDNKTDRLPTNPEEVTVKSVQANEKYEILKLGQIAVPTHMELKEYSFECEFPHIASHYVETSGNFKDADYYIKEFEKIRDEKKPIRFIASNGIGEDINTLVLIEEIEIKEKAGEEGDKYISFSLIEYRPYGKITVVIPISTNSTVATVKKEEPKEQVNPKSTGSYVVQSGDNLYAIAKKHYGDGDQYSKIANANKDRIKNPSLIYPGQKLVIPV